MKRTITILLFALITTATGQAAETPNLHDFARMMPLTLSGTGALHEVSLPSEVYAVATRRDLGDIAVFNGAGEIVPFTLILPSPTRTALAGQELPLFPLTGTAPRQQGGIAMQVRSDKHGAIINLTTAPGSVSAIATTGYIVDARTLDHPVTGFDVGLTPVAHGFVGTVRVECSDDLQQWRQHAVAAVATLSAGERHLSKDRIEFPPIKARYFRLTSTPGQGVPQIRTVTARLESPLAAQRRETALYIITPVKGKSGEYVARITGHMPVDRLRVIFPDENSLAGVTFLSRADDESPWIERGCGTFYRLRRDASIVESGPLDITPTTDRQWLIRVRHSGGGLGSILPQLEVGWQPHRLIFAARGEAPFSLAYGSARSGLDSVRDDTIAAGLASWEKQQIRPLPAKCGASVEAGGKQALKPRIPATTWRKALLWGALSLGVLLLAGMAWRLVKEMGLDDVQKKATKSDNSVLEKGLENHDT